MGGKKVCSKLSFYFARKRILLGPLGFQHKKFASIGCASPEDYISQNRFLPGSMEVKKEKQKNRKRK